MEIKYNQPDNEYFSVEAASNSTLSRMVKSPAHCKEYLDNPVSQTPSMLLGSVVHTAVLEPQFLVSRYVVSPKFDKRTKQGKADFAEFEIESAGKTVISDEFMLLAQNIMNSIKNHKAASELLKHTKKEVSLFWYDEENDIDCKSRLDLVDEADYMLADLKTTQDASAEGFAKSIVNFGYHRQAAMYLDGFAATYNKEPRGFKFIAAETKAPFAVAVYELDKESIEVGRTEYRELLKQFAICKHNDEWPGYSQDVQEISLPNWKFAKNDSEIIEGIF